MGHRWNVFAPHSFSCHHGRDLNMCVSNVCVGPAPVSCQGSNVKERAGPKWLEGVLGGSKQTEERKGCSSVK